MRANGIAYRLLGLALRARDRWRRSISFTLLGLVSTTAFALGFLLRFEFSWPQEYTRVFWSALPVLLVIRLGLAWLLKLTRCRWRFVGTEDLLRLMVATTSGSFLFYVLTWNLGIPVVVPRSVILLEWVFSAYGVGGMWLTYRVLFERIRRNAAREGGSDRRVLIVGAGEAGAMLVGEMKRVPVGLMPVGLVDDDPGKQGVSIHGVPVLGKISAVGAVADLVSAQELVIAIPTATPEVLTRIVEVCQATDRPFRLLPGIPEVLLGKAKVHQLRAVRVEDLLGREPVSLELPELAEELKGECVLVSGAAGSIGSELSRQVALHQPACLLLLDQAETPLVDLLREMRESFPDLTMVPLVRDITDKAGIEVVFRKYRPRRVFHAAAYKHVPMMEENGVEAIRNNVYGTWVLAAAAGRSSSSHFILISSDKAVSPVNLMGASKRLAEITMLEAQRRYPETAFGAVRFGNVLGSNGSVIPLFRQQLEEGRPLTVTHPEMTRYFMTIPEAVQLVLQASLLPDLKGHIAMLEMGNPVRIVDLAKRVLRLSGAPCKVGRDIVFTGIRPGEKLREELVWTEEHTRPTGVPKVYLVVSSQSWPPGLTEKVKQWISEPAAEDQDIMKVFSAWFRKYPAPLDDSQTWMSSEYPVS